MNELLRILAIAAASFGCVACTYGTVIAPNPLPKWMRITCGFCAVVLITALWCAAC